MIKVFLKKCEGIFKNTAEKLSVTGESKVL
jgi:hypothetical protein